MLEELTKHLKEVRLNQPKVTRKEALLQTARIARGKSKLPYCPYDGCFMVNGASRTVALERLCLNCDNRYLDYTKYCPRCKFCSRCNRIVKKFIGA